MLEKTMKKFDELMTIMSSEMVDIFKKIPGKFGKQTKIKIKSGSTIIINGATAKLLNDVTVLTDNPNQLMENK